MHAQKHHPDNLYRLENCKRVNVAAFKNSTAFLQQSNVDFILRKHVDTNVGLIATVKCILLFSFVSYPTPEGG